ncbi:MAG: hypothetical protein IJN79_00860 [Clostridia bacterium]|nr:hypothetical protein [Clostridia bacterium]MBQ4609208.1 hypothetical protein [Clostridia bacterium]MBQ7051336.1 hypothetical protein [Clostridia bacterium]
MAGRLDQVESMLRSQLGGALLERCPDLVYAVNQSLVRFGRTSATLSVLWRQIDSALFNAVYTGTDRSMVVILDDGTRMRVRSDAIRDMADRLLSLAYVSSPVTDELQDALFDFAREGSYAAMRELVRRFPMDEFERSCYEQVLEENGQSV